MDCEETPLAGAFILTPRRFGDARGWFSEVWNSRTLAEVGIEVAFVQDNHSFSAPKGTLRGLHYQSPPHAQGKLVRCASGTVWDVAVDVRGPSSTYGAWHGVELSAENGRQFWIPEGFLHAFVTLTENAEVLYKCTDHYAPDCDGGVLWNSASLGIDWPLDGDPILSEKDATAPDFADWTSPFA